MTALILFLHSLQQLPSSISLVCASTLVAVLPVHFMARRGQPWTLISSANLWQKKCQRLFLSSELQQQKIPSSANWNGTGKQMVTLHGIGLF